METKLERITKLSKENPDMVFTSIGHLINKEMLKDCHKSMDGSKAVGIDGITKEEYGRDLERNLEELVSRLKRKAYKPKPARRVEIPKDNGKTRPLSIYCYEDKLVQEALKRILEAVFEPHLYDEMWGFRPNRNCHKALKSLTAMLEHHITHFVLDADIKGFFDNIDHNWAIRFIESKIKDPNIIRLVRVMLKSGIMKDFQYEDTDLGSGQGSVCSPIIANIYMHYVLVWWFKTMVQPYCKGFSGLVVYADDFVACFDKEEDARGFYVRLKRRMKLFGLSLEESKTRLIRFGWFAKEDCAKAGKKPETFTFLGFTHYCTHAKNGKFRVGRKTSKKKFAKKCKEVNSKLRIMRNKPLKSIIDSINRMLAGYYNYYYIQGNRYCVMTFRRKVIIMLYYWLNRRSQKRSYTWKRFNELLKAMPIISPHNPISLFPFE